MFCKHKWEVIKETREETSLAERIRSGEGFEVKGVPYVAYIAKYILVCQCTKCGKLDKTIVDIG